MKSIKLAPNVTQVFLKPEACAPYFLPVLSFDLSEVYDDLSGRLHFIDAIEPYDGYIGEETGPHHTYYCRENWISFKVKDGLYDFETTEHYFYKTFLQNNPAPERVHESVRDNLVQDFETHYVERAAKYAKWTQDLPKDPLKDLGLSLGGRPNDANWAHCTDFPLQVDKEDVPGQSFPDTYHYPLTEDGRRLRFIGRVETFDWRCALHLFYDPVEKRAVQTFDWT